MVSKFTVWNISKSQQLSYILLMLSGAAVMFIPAAYSFFTILLPKTPAMGITFVGAVIGTALFMEGRRRYGLTVTPINVGELLEDTKQARKESETAKQEVARLNQEVGRLQSMKLNVNSVKNMWSLTLLEIETVFRDFKTEEVETIPASTFSRKTVFEYLGYIDKRIKVAYGIDLNKIRIRVEGSKFVVSGIKCEQQNYQVADVVKEHHEMREKWVSANGAEECSIVQDDKNQRLFKAYKNHGAELQKKLNSGVDLSGLEGAAMFVENAGKEFIQTIFLPTGRQIVFIDEHDERGDSLENFVQKYNRLVGTETQKRAERIKLLEAK